MLGYPPSNASFHMLEVMASPRFHLKQVGYLAASQCFNEDTDVLILATNLLKKDLRSSAPLDVAVALNGLSHIVTPDLAQHLAPDIITLLTHTRPSIRKKALLVLYSVILHYPPALESALPRLSEKLEDDDVGVISATINIICELSRNNTSNAKLFLTLSPQFFHLLTTSTNNWMLIKIIKLFGVLTPLEPRLVRKLVPPISQIISTTPAMSLLYECIHTMIIGKMLIGPEGDSLATTCVEKLATFLDDDDQNLKYIALLALVKIIPTHPHLVAVHQESIFESMEDDDLSIRLRALDLVSGMAGRSNFRAIVEHQLKHIEPGQSFGKTSAAASLKLALQNNTSHIPSSTPWLSASYRLEIINRILNLGSQETYSNVIDFEWYVDVLVKLAYLANESVGDQIASQLIDVASRVRAVRVHAIAILKKVLEDFTAFDEKQEMEFALLRAAAWICGEYCQSVAYPPAIISLLLRKETLSCCSAFTKSMMIHSAIKLLAWWLLQLSKYWKEDQLTDVKSMTREVSDALDYWKASEDAEVEERATEYRQLLLLIEKNLEDYETAGTNDLVPVALNEGWVESGNEKEKTTGPKCLLLLSPLFFSYNLGPVAKKAQEKVALPLNLNLESWIVDSEEVQVVDPWEIEEKEAASREKRRKFGTKASKPSIVVSGNGTNVSQAEAKERARLKADRLKRQQESPFYIGSSTNDVEAHHKRVEVDVDDIPIVQLQLDGELQGKVPDSIEAKGMAPNFPQAVVVQEDEEMPEESSTAQITKRVVGTRKKKKARAVALS